VAEPRVVLGRLAVDVVLVAVARLELGGPAPAADQGDDAQDGDAAEAEDEERGRDRPRAAVSARARPSWRTTTRRASGTLSMPATVLR
jgi:hypothetical protein